MRAGYLHLNNMQPVLLANSPSSPLSMHVLQHVIAAETLIAPASNENTQNDTDSEP
jgi:hypothetical protein